MNYRAFACFAIIPMLAACSGEPSQRDIEQAYRSHVEQINAFVGNSVSANDRTVFRSAKKLGCTAASDGVYQCQVDLSMKTMFGEMQGELPQRFVQRDGQWRVID